MFTAEILTKWPDTRHKFEFSTEDELNDFCHAVDEGNLETIKRFGEVRAEPDPREYEILNTTRD